MNWIKTLFTGKKPVIIFGGTGQSKLVRPLLERQGYKIIAVFDKDTSISPPFSDIPLYPEDHHHRFILDWYLHDKGNLYFCLTMCNPHGRKRLWYHDHLIKYYKLKSMNVIDPTAKIAHNAIIGDGVQILANANIMEEAKISEQCIIDVSAVIHHECQLGPATNVASGAILCGLVKTGINTFIGTNATILPRLTLGDDVIVGANAVVINNIESGVVVAGVPAKIIRRV